jgi:hypothetical protein
MNPSSTYGMNQAAFTTPTSNGVAASDWTTRTGIATAVTAVPNELIAAAVQ